MPYENPDAILYSSDGYEIAVQNNISTPTGTRGLLIAGTDGTTRFANVKASSTAAAVGDNSLVVALSPNSPLPSGTNSIGAVTVTGLTLPFNIIGNAATGNAPSGAPVYMAGLSTTSAPAYSNNTVGPISLDGSGNVRVASSVNDTVATGALGALNASVQIALNGQQSVGFQLAAGTLRGTLVAEISVDGGTTWSTTYFDQTNSNKVSSIVFSTNNTALTSTIVGVGGSGFARIRVSAYTSGTANITLRAANIYDPSVLFAGTSGSTSLPVTTAQVGGSVTTNSPTYSNGTLNALSIDTTGNLRVIQTANDITATGALGSLNAAVQVSLNGKTTAGFQLAAGTLIGTLVAEISIDGGTTWNATYFDQTNNNKVSSIVFSSANTALASTIIGVGGMGLARVRVSAYTSGTANITLRSSNVEDPSVLFAGTSGSSLPPTIAQIGGKSASNTLQVPQVDTFPGGTLNQMYVAATLSSPLAGAAGLYVTPTFYGTLSVSNEPNSLFNDPFSGALDTTNLWNSPVTSGAGASVSTTNGILTLTASTTANAYASLSSQPTFRSNALGFLTVAFSVKLEATAVTGQEKFWGIATTPGSLTTSSSLTDAIGFEQDTTGALSAVIYASGTKIFSQVLTRLNDGGYHRYAIQTRPDVTAWYYENTEVPAAYVSYMDTNSSLLPIHMHVVNGASPSGAGTFTFQTAVAGDTAPNGISISDGLYSWRKSTIKPSSTTPTATDTSLVVSLSPNTGHIKGTVQPLYGSSGQSVTITLTSLAANNARASTVVSNTTNLYEDVLLFFKIATASSGVSATGYVNIYGYGSVDGGSNYPEGITGTDAGVTLTSPPNLILIAQINANAVSKTYTYGPVSFCRTYGIDRLPASWGIVVTNNTGAALSGTAGNFLVEYQGVNGQLV